MGRSMLVLAPAKLNLTLDVLGLRPDGYHEIRSIMQTVSLYDGIVLEEAAGLQVENPVGELEEDLVYRAARLFFHATGIAPRVRLSLAKRIPVGAGLGGGSSDAAATLRLLNAWHRRALGEEDLHALACQLGSDVAFFLRGGTALVEGRGDKIEPLPPIRDVRFLIIKPPFALATRAVYEAFRRRPAPVGRHTERFFRARQEGAWSFGNDLTEAAVACQAELAELLRVLRQEGLSLLTLTGSGSAFFHPILDGPVDQAVRTAERLGCQVFLVQPVSRLPRITERIGSHVVLSRGGSD